MARDATLDTLTGYSAAGSTDLDFATLGAVHLDVTDGARSVGFWRDLIGLELLGEDAGGAGSAGSAGGAGDAGDAGALRLGVGGRELLVLHPGASAPVPRGRSGLYHLALHVPDAPELARVVARLAAARYRQGPTDHVMSLANYVNDPDGNGLEVTLETPHRQRSMSVSDGGIEIIDAAGRARGGRDPIDLDWLLGQLPGGAGGDLGRPLPATTVVGHLHLHVASVDDALAFYRDALGFTLATHSQTHRMADLHAGGSFRHRIAVNTWQGEGAPSRPAGTAGLRHFTLVFRTERDLAAALDRATSTGARSEPHDGGTLVRDPAGNGVLLTNASGG